MNRFRATLSIAGLILICGNAMTLAQGERPPSDLPPAEKAPVENAALKEAETNPSDWIVNDRQAIRRQLESSLSAHPAVLSELAGLDWDAPVDLHQRLIACLRKVPDNRNWLQRAREAGQAWPAESATNGLDPHVQLEIAMILVKTNRHDQALELIKTIDRSRLVEPGLALLYQTICLHQQVQVEKASRIAAILMAHRDELPLRYARITESLYTDLRKHEDQPLHTVARLMSDAGRRQLRQEHSAEALRQEAEIVEKLDQIIEDLEKQQQQANASSPSSSRPSPSSPDSGESKSLPQTGGPEATGDVQSKTQDAAGNWGKLSDEERAIAVKSMVKELPPHFQSLLKAYFQKLAEEKK